MGRKKASDETLVGELDRDSLYKEVTKEFGDDIIIPARQLVERSRQVIPMSPNMDIILGGGIEEGSWITISGKPKSGKSLSCLHFAAQAQKPENGARHVYYHNIEHRLRKRDLQGIQGLDLDKITVVESTEEKILTTKDHLTIAQKEIYNDLGCVVIIDSLSALCDEKEFAEGLGKEIRASGHRLISQFVNQMSNVVPVKRSIVFSIVHLMANVTGYGAAFVEKMNNRLAYQNDYKLRVKSFADFTEGDTKVGIITSWKCETTPLGIPGKEIDSYIRFGIGIDAVAETVDLALKLPGMIDKAAAWYKLEYLGEDCPKLNGLAKVYDYLRENPDSYEKLVVSVRELIA
jgi:recombination protein RecA